MEKKRAEQIRRREVACTLKGMELSSKEEEAVERLSRSLVNELLRGPLAVAAALISASVETSEARRDVCAS
jgi:glutamyl-tRNA reductase